VQLGQGQVVGPEVVAPLRDAVRLVDREQRDGAPVQQPRRGLHAQPFRRQVEQVQLAGQEGRLHLTALLAVLRGVQEAGAHAQGGERIHLVLHQGDQRRHHNADAVPDQCGIW